MWIINVKLNALEQILNNFWRCIVPINQIFVLSPNNDLKIKKHRKYYPFRYLTRDGYLLVFSESNWTLRTILIIEHNCN